VIPDDNTDDVGEDDGMTGLTTMIMMAVMMVVMTIRGSVSLTRLIANQTV
jgi:hypothetical protein